MPSTSCSGSDLQPGSAASFITLLSGARLALTSRWGLFRHWWVIAKLAIYGATLAIGLVLISPSLDTMLEVTEAGGSQRAARARR